MVTSKELLIKKITEIFEKYSLSRKGAIKLVPTKITDGKLYEAYVLSIVAEKLVKDEKYDILLKNDNFIQLKSYTGPIDRYFPRLDVLKNKSKIAEIWTDVEFVSLSNFIRGGNPRSPLRSEYHEMDILMVDPELHDRPRFDQIWMAIECKNTTFSKKILRELLGVRREMCLLTGEHNKTKFNYWPRTQVRTNPPSCLSFFSTDESILKYTEPGEIYGISFHYEKMPNS